MVRIMTAAIISASILMLSLGQAAAPEYMDPQPTPHVTPTRKVLNISRGGEPEPKIEKRVMRITAYTNHDPGMDGKGITKSGERTQEGRTIAAPSDIPLYSEIYIPALGETYVVTARGGAIKGNRLDLFIADRNRALEFGVKELEVIIKE